MAVSEKCGAKHSLLRENEVFSTRINKSVRD